MAKFYGQVSNGVSTTASRVGHQGIRASAQSYDGSVITSLRYDDEGKLMVHIEIADSSSMYGDTVFRGTLEELKEKLKQ